MGNGRSSGLPKGVRDTTSKLKAADGLRIKVPDSIYRSRSKDVINKNLDVVRSLFSKLGIDPKSMPEYVMGLSRSNTAYASVNAAGFMNIGMVGKDYDSWMRHYANDVAMGWHPAGTTGDAVLAHEFGHIIERAIVDKNMPNAGVFERISAWHYGDYSTEIVKAAAKEVYGANVNLNERVGALTGYGREHAENNNGSQSETFAEAFAYYAQHGPGKNPFVDSIVKHAKKMLK